MTESNKSYERKYYLDNIRHGTILLVVIYHVLYIFNSAGVISNIPQIGIQQMDTLMYFVYPWFMCLLFVISGMGARYALSKKTAKEFVKDRFKRLLVPSIAGIFVFGWITGWVTNQYVDVFSGNGDTIPAVIKFFIFSLMGIGPLWFAHELFLASMVLLLIRAIDKKDKLWELGGKVNLIVILLMFFLVWGSSKILNTPVVISYRNGIYIFLFLLGYYVFSHDKIQNILQKWRIPLMAAALICGVAYTVFYYGTNYTADECLQSSFTNTYLWLMILALIGCGKAYLNKKTKFTLFMAPRSFGIYVLHYPVLVLAAYLILTYLNLPMILNYIVLLLADFIMTLSLYEAVKRIPIVRFLLLGKSKEKA